MNDNDDNTEHEELFKNSIEAPKLVYWASLGNLEQVKKSLEEEPDVNVKDSGGLTALDLALGNNHTEVIEFLIANGAVKTK